MQKMLLAIDGGGTKTEFVLFSPNGHIKKRLVLSGTNPNSVGIDRTVQVLEEGIGKLSEGENIAFVHAGIAGCSNPAHQEAIAQSLKARFENIPCAVESDTLNVINSAESGEKCIAAICGTGSVVFAKTLSGLHRIGGWGYRFDTAGSGFDIGRDAVRAVFAQYEGMGPETKIAQFLEEEVGGDLWLNVNKLYSVTPEKIASFAKHVIKAWDMGDEAAADILRQNMERLAYLITFASQKHDCGETLILAGGLTAREDMLREFLYPLLPTHLKPVVARMPQIYGACVLCAKESGMLQSGFAETFEKSYNEIRGDK